MESLSVSSSNRNLAERFCGDRIKGTLPPGFYSRETALVARELLGKIVVVRPRPRMSLDVSGALVTAGRIVETEAYSGSDPASHSARGETPRCSIMFGEPGRAYVYFIYGMYEMLNFVTEPKGFPGAVLIRALEPVYGLDLMLRRRGLKQTDSHKKLLGISNGPGRLSRALGIKMSHKGAHLDGPSIFVVDDGTRPERICASPRVGIKEGSALMWRFFDARSPFVSDVPRNRSAR